MQIVSRILSLPEGNFQADVQEFEDADRIQLWDLYTKWRDINELLGSLHSRKVNLMEGLSESAFCIEMNSVRLIGSIKGQVNTSWDCYSLSSEERIQVKACSVIPDLTSFGPSSQWDRLYFLNFFRQGNWDGTFDIYSIPNDMIYNHYVNRNQTLRQQQRQGRRPRFSIWKELIEPNDLYPIAVGNINPHR